MKARLILFSLFAIACLGGGIVAIATGLDLATQTDVTCDDWVMHVGDRCLHTGRRGSWYNDFAQQRLYNQQHGVMNVMFGAVSLFAAALFVFGMIYTVRWYRRHPAGAPALAPPPKVDPWRRTSYRVALLVLCTFFASIYPVGMLLETGEWRNLLVIPPTMAFTYGAWLYSRKKMARESASTAPPGIASPPYSSWPPPGYGPYPPQYPPPNPYSQPPQYPGSR